MRTTAEKQDDDLSLVFDHISQLLDSGFYGRIIISVKNSMVYDLKTEQGIRLSELRERKKKLKADEK